MSAMTDFVSKVQLAQVETENGDVFQLKNCIGEGGQGAVYATQQKGRLVKLSFARKGSEENIKDAYRRYKILRNGNLPEQLAKPLFEIKPVEMNDVIIYGYVMELMDDMVSLGSQFCKKGERPDAYIHRMGGIRRMYVILRKVAEILDCIHSVGYCYGDLNPNNVFISASTDYDAVQLIDCDNLMVAADCKGSIYFPGYGAPEILKGLSQNSFITDSWSFAVLTFYTLRQTLPFVGKMVADAATMEISQMEKKAEFAELPFIDDESGENASRQAFPKAIMETKALQDLFARTFGKNVLPFSRPTLSAWIEALQQGECQFFKCAASSCGHVFLRTKGEVKCPFCDGTIVEANATVAVLLSRDKTSIRYGSPLILSDKPVVVEFPISECAMRKLEINLDAVQNKLSLKLLPYGDQEIYDSIEVLLAINDSGKGKKMDLAPEIPTLVPIKNGEMYYFNMPAYKNSLDQVEEGESPMEIRAVVAVMCRGLNG